MVIGELKPVCTTSLVAIGGRFVSGRGTAVMVMVALDLRRFGSWIV